MKNIMCINSRHIFCLLFGIVSFFCFIVPVQTNAMTLGKNYFNLVKKTLNVSSDEIMKKADEYFTKNNLDTAFIYYMILCNRTDNDLPADEHRLSAMDILKKGNIFYMKGSYADALNSYFTGLRI